MWPLVAAGMLTGAFCIDVCVTVAVVVMTVIVVAFSKPSPDVSDPPATFDSSALRVSTEGGGGEVRENEESKSDTQTATSTHPPGREMTANPRRVTTKPQPSTESQEPPTVRVHPRPSHGVFVGGRDRDAQMRLMQTMKKEMLSARLHQFEKPRVTPPTH